MIVLDTNVLSALMQQQPDAQVAAWLDKQPAESIWISSITLFEARYGLALLAAGQRKSLLQERFDQLLQDDLENRVLLFDSQRGHPGRPGGRRTQSTRPPRGYARHLHCPGIALARRATLATRNTRHFDDLSVPMVNPWTDRGKHGTVSF